MFTLQQTASSALIGVMLVAQSAGCARSKNVDSHSASPRHNERVLMTVDQINELLPLGTPLATLEKRWPTYERVDWMVTSSSSAPGGIIDIEGLIKLGFAVDKADRVFFISTGSEEIRLPGTLHVGDSFSAARTIFPAEELIKWPGYGTLMRVAPQTWLLFDDTIDPIDPESKIVAVEVRNDLH